MRCIDTIPGAVFRQAGLRGNARIGTLANRTSQVAWRIHAVMQDTNDCNPVVCNTKVNYVSFNISATIAKPDVVAGWS